MCLHNVGGVMHEGEGGGKDKLGDGGVVDTLRLEGFEPSLEGKSLQWSDFRREGSREGIQDYQTRHICG
ncbi:hypothetical protein WH91_08865 [Devosia psychrophila]|uniref:Uncharacterized protein n=1 Tax=Devosia psychrophila TaxID=728005 RepID=A0ABR5DZ92_9HYPH|nr:hypothetical protein WH91_08865 [Devosia psychrophila]